MINKVMTPDSILENFKLVIESARIDYRENNIHSEILESIDLSSEISANLVSGENDRLGEAINVTDAKIVREKNGTAISVKVNGTEYRYVSANKSTAELYRSFMGQLKHANAGYKALNWLKKNALEYYGSKNPSEEGKKLIGISESKESVKLEATQPSDLPPNDADEEISESRRTGFENIPRYLYHATAAEYTNNILRNGLLTKTGEGHQARYSPRVYLARSKADCRFFAFQKFSINSKIVSIFQVDTHKLSRSHKFAEDPAYKDKGVFTTKPIPASALKLINDGRPELEKLMKEEESRDPKQEKEILQRMIDLGVPKSIIELQRVRIAKLESSMNINESLSLNAEVFRTDKTGMSYYDDFLNKQDHDYKRLAKGLQGEIIYMSPDEYIRRLGAEIFHCSTARVLRGVAQDNVDQIASKMSSGTKYNLPILDLANETQEGRHRALAAESLGVLQIPILVVTKWDPHKELKMPKSMNLWYGHTIEWTRKDGTPDRITVGLDLEKVRKKVEEIIKSGDYKK